MKQKRHRYRNRLVVIRAWSFSRRQQQRPTKGNASYLLADANELVPSVEIAEC